MKIEAGLKFRLGASVEYYKRLLQDGWAGCENGMIEQIEGESVAVRFVDGQAWRFLRPDFEAVTAHHDWPGEIIWQ